MNPILILQAHPRLGNSVVQTAMRQAVANMPGSHTRDLYALYPDFAIDTRAEQRALEAARIIVIQCPFYWYSTPAIVKEWLDLVLEHGWAYGPGGTALEGKYLINALSTAGSDHAYSTQGHNMASVRDFLLPFRQTAATCGMTWLEPFTLYQGRKLLPETLTERATAYRHHLEALRDSNDPSTVHASQ
jgi:glutathione-regulated potassium-efflux system ancillary protein KefG